MVNFDSSRIVIQLAKVSKALTASLGLFPIIYTGLAACYIQVLIRLGAGADEVWMAVQDDHPAGQGFRAINN